MSLPGNIRDRDYNAYTLSDGKVARRVYVDNDELNAIPIINVNDSIVTKIINSPDVEVSYEFEDAGTINERIKKITYYSLSLNQTLERNFSYVLEGHFYILEKKTTNLI